MVQMKIDFDEVREIEKEKSLLFHVHEDIEEAAKFYKIPLIYCLSSNVYILQEDRCVYVGSRAGATNFIKKHEGKLCRSWYEIISKEEKEKRTCPDGRLHGEFIGYGAHTGRWSTTGSRVKTYQRDPKPTQYERINSKPVGIEVKRFILTRILATLLYVPHYDVKVKGFVELKTCVRVYYTIAGEKGEKKLALPWWTLVATKFDK